MENFDKKNTPPANGANRNDGNRNITKNIDFLQHIFSDVNENSYLWLTSFKKYPDRNSKSESNLCWSGSAINSNEIASLPSRFLSADNNNFFCTSSFKNRNGKKNRQEENFSACHMLLLDDIGVKVDASKIPLKPTYKVETSPGNFQFGYVLSDPIKNVEDLKIIVKILADRGMTDAGGACFNKYGRLPVGINNKPQHVERLGREWVQSFEPEFFMEKTSLSAFLDAFQIDLKKERRDIFDKKYNTPQPLPQENLPTKNTPPQVKIRFKATPEQDKQLIDAITSSPYFITYRDNFIIDMRCPWAHSHTTGDQAGETSYFLPSHAFPDGGFKCFHSHCDGKNLGDLRRFFGNDTKVVPINKFVNLQGARQQKEEYTHKKESDLKSKNPFPMDSLFCPGLIGDIAEWILDTSPHPVPEAALGAAVTLVSTVIGRRYQRVGDYDTRSNLYTAVIAKSSRGKNFPLSCVRKILRETGLEGYMGGRIKSGQGIESALCSSPEPIKLYPIDEFGKLLSKVTSKNAQSWEKEVENVLLELYSSSNGIYLGGDFSDGGKSDAKKRIDIEQPHLCLFGVSTPNSFFSSLNSSSIASGFLNRFVILQSLSKRELKRRHIKSKNPPSSVIERIKMISEIVKPDGNLERYTGAKPSKIIDVTETEEATNFLIEKEIYINKKMEKLEERGIEEIYGRYEENLIKWALTRAVGTNLSRPQITLEDLKWSDKIIGWSMDSLLASVTDDMADNKVQDSLNKIKKMIKNSDDGILRGDLMARIGLGKREFDDLLPILIERDLISEARSNVGKRGKPGIKYIWRG